MESKSVRKIDILNILKCVLNKWIVVLVIAVGCAGLLGGYEYFMYKVQAKNELFVNSTKKDLVYGSYLIYVNNFDDSDNYYNRLEDVQAIIKGHGVLGEVIEKHGLNINYDIMSNCVAIVPVGINLMEISFEGSLIGLNQEQVLDVTESICKISTDQMDEFFGVNCVVITEEPHADAYELKSATTIDEEDQKKITKKTVIKFGLLGGVIGGFAGVLAVIFYILISPVLRTKNEVVECYGMSLLGAVIKKADKEEYKRIVKRIKDKAVLAFVSATDSEKRSEAAGGVAGAIAVNGVKAVVVKIAKGDDASANSLYGYITGKGDVKSMVEDTDNASVKCINWTEGSTADIDLFTNSKFAEVVETLKSMYDYVIIDCPMMKESATGLNVASVCDGVVVVGSCGIVKEQDVEKLKYDLTENDIKPLGLLYIE